MESNIYETKKEYPFGYDGLRGYKIQLDLSVKHRPLQRHIWFKEDGLIEEEEWISFVSSRTPDELINRGYIKI
jgi:hypothetical protein